MVSLGTSGYLSKYDSRISVSYSVVVALLNIRCPFDRKGFGLLLCGGVLLSLLLQQGVRDLGRGFAYLLEFFFRLIFDLQIVSHRHMVFSRDRAGLPQKASVNIETPGRLTEGSGNDLLPVAAQQPIDENLSAIRVCRSFDYRQIAATPGAVISLFKRGKNLDRQPRFQKRHIGIIGKTDHEGDSTFGQAFRKQALITAEI